MAGVGPGDRKRRRSEVERMICWFHERATAGTMIREGLSKTMSADVMCARYECKVIGDPLPRVRRSRAEITQKLLQAHDEWKKFEIFRNLPGVKFDEETNTLATFTYYYDNLPHAETKEWRKFRHHGIKNYAQKKFLFGAGGCINDLDWDWLIKSSNSEGIELINLGLPSDA